MLLSMSMHVVCEYGGHLRKKCILLFLEKPRIVAFKCQKATIVTIVKLSLSQKATIVTIEKLQLSLAAERATIVTIVKLQLSLQEWKSYNCHFESDNF